MGEFQIAGRVREMMLMLSRRYMGYDKLPDTGRAYLSDAGPCQDKGFPDRDAASCPQNLVVLIHNELLTTLKS